MKRRSTNRPSRPAAGPAAERILQIEKPVYGGAFLARDEGKAVFTPLVLPGETARVQIVEDRERRGYARAELVELQTRSPERSTPPCPHFGPCGGCDYQHATYEAQLKIKQHVLRETLERGGVRTPDEIEVVAGEPWQYRNRIRVAFDANGDPGYRGRRSHGIVPIRECPIAAPVLVEAALAAADLFRSMDARNQPAEISLFCDARGDALLASVFAAPPAAARLADQLNALMLRIPRLTGVNLVEVRGEQTRTVAENGEAALKYRAGEFDYRVDNGAFFQVNRWLIDPLIRSVVDTHTGRTAWDLFAGVGLFARQLAFQFERVIAVEAATSAAEALRANLAGSSGEARILPVDEFLLRNAGSPRPDWIVMDPPRTGLGEEAVKALTGIAAPKIAYVSCDPATLARDLRVLLAGGYAMESLTLIDLFPQTFHLESVVQLRRA